MRVVFSKKSAEEIRKLDTALCKRIVEKLLWFSRQENPLDFAKQLSDSRLGDYRFRIGDYRVIFDLGDDEILVLRVGHRREIYEG